MDTSHQMHLWRAFQWKPQATQVLKDRIWTPVHPQYLVKNWCWEICPQKTVTRILERNQQVLCMVAKDSSPGLLELGDRVWQLSRQFWEICHFLPTNILNFQWPYSYVCFEKRLKIVSMASKIMKLHNTIDLNQVLHYELAILQPGKWLFFINLLTNIENICFCAM